VSIPDPFAGLKPCCSNAVYHANPAGSQAYFTCDIHDLIRDLRVSVETEKAAVEQALSRSRGLALQNRQLKRANHQLHVSLQHEIDNRVKGEGLRAKVRELEAELVAKQEDYDDLDDQLHSTLKREDALKARVAELKTFVEWVRGYGHSDSAILEKAFALKRETKG